DSDILISRASVHGLNGDREQAREDFDSAAKINPTYARLLYERANSNVRNGMIENALTDLAELIRQQPNSIDPYIARIYAYLDSDQFDKAIADADTIIGIRANACTYGVR